MKENDNKNLYAINGAQYLQFNDQNLREISVNGTQENIQKIQYREFSSNENYVMEQIPENIGFFKRKKWIKEKISLLGKQKALIFMEKSRIMWAFLDDDQKYWMPAEKTQFYLYAFEDNGSSTLIMEKTANGVHYYGVVDKFLVVYTKDYNQAIENISRYNNGRKIKVLGVADNSGDSFGTDVKNNVGNSIKSGIKNSKTGDMEDADYEAKINEENEITVAEIELLEHGSKNRFEYIHNFEQNCDKMLSIDEIIEKVLSIKELSTKEHASSAFVSEINDDLIYLNEDHDQSFCSASLKNEASMDDAFLYWFSNLKNKTRYKRKYVLGALLTGILLFSIADIYCAYNGARIKKELEVTMEKIAHVAGMSK